MKIIRLKAENVKRLRAVEITPEGDVVVIGGKNGAGKSSVLDSIMYALGGKGTHCRQPVRAGEDKATIVCELEGLTVKRTITKEGGGTLTVESADGARYPSPQAVLDKLTGSLSFDPLAFSRQHPGDQSETLRGLVGIDLSASAETRAEVYSIRTGVNRDGKALAARFDAMPPIQVEVPDVEVSASEILDEIKAAEGVNTLRLRVLQDASAAAATHAEAVPRLEVAEAAYRDARDADAQAAKAANLLQPEVDIAPLRARLESVEDTNRRVRENIAHRLVAEELEAKRRRSADLTKQIAEIDAERAAAIASAKYPVPGLGFDEGGVVTLGGLPFDQASSAEQLRVSVAMGLALNPELRVLLVRDGSLLDDDSLRMVAEMAAEADAQVWIERVEDDEHVGVLIEDGSVVARAEPKEEQNA